ncbi:MAG TPA: hypothetical protein VL092_08105 [Chitinophagaceae bacterium]|nr:hypothetical protein [Chitinophagaceae bacterium]
MVKLKLVLFLLLSSCLLLSCRQHEAQRPEIAFYYWRTDFSLKPGEQRLLSNIPSAPLYLRYFDLVYDETAACVLPVSPVSVRSAPTQRIIPVVFIKNKVWERTDSLGIDSLAEHTLQLCRDINRRLAIHPNAVQIDCDWTSGTGPRYFYFLNLLRQKLQQAAAAYAFAPGTQLSATIRLHQVKYPGRQGIPPADRGVLMYYNMGKIGAGAENSIYEEETGLQYIRALKKYPLPLDFALPVFAWGIHIREGRVVELLNKMDSRDFDTDSRFRHAGVSRYSATASFFKNGFYFKEGDEVKVEEVKDTDLLRMARTLKKYYDHPVQRVVFYDLDSINISRYEEDIFTKVADRL